MLTNVSWHISPPNDCKEVDLLTKAQSPLTTKYYFEVGDRKIAGKVSHTLSPSVLEDLHTDVRDLLLDSQ